jgi:transcriptional regulator with PAS, ATPase and Fis domain
MGRRAENLLVKNSSNSSVSKTPAFKDPMLYSTENGRALQITSWVGERFKGTEFILVHVTGNTPPDACSFEGLKPEPSFTRALVVFEGLPINLAAVGLWREWVMRRGAWDLRMAFVESNPTEETFKQVVEKNCAEWFAPWPPKENDGIVKGKKVQMPKGNTVKDDPSLLTMMFGSMGELLAKVEVVARRFKNAVEPLKKSVVQKYLGDIDSLLLTEASPQAKSKRPSLGLDNITDQLPKLLLRGDSGVGKTLIASYLHAKSGLKGRPLHISIPEYLGKEDMFEYTLFGYVGGNYTGGKPGGDHGLFLENVGGVVFLDEIGEANAALQAKLLAFLDHYMVRPRGWLNDPFYCPVLVVAATNRDLDKKIDGKLFRRDLLARFTDRHPIPALRDRMEDLPFILDCLLQRESINPGGLVEQIGEKALRFLANQPFDGNFRELEDLLRGACQQAQREGRPYLSKTDFVPRS